tara:strand:+ start:328 stop:540 length:213 start_codon:yes stop_codon:yes gene_type:complete
MDIREELEMLRNQIELLESGDMELIKETFEDAEEEYLPQMILEIEEEIEALIEKDIADEHYRTHYPGMRG